MTRDDEKTTVRMDSLEELADDPALANVSRGADAENGFHTRILAGRVMGALGELTEQQRLIFLLKHREGMTCQEIAEVFGCSVGSVKKSLFRSLEKLRASFGIGARADGGAALPAVGKS
jgi:RNA polymerase sigma-70 factor (ECF subfamily)